MQLAKRNEVAITLLLDLKLDDSIPTPTVSVYPSSLLAGPNHLPSLPSASALPDTTTQCSDGFNSSTAPLKASRDSGLSRPAEVAVILGVLLSIVATSFLFWYCMRRKRMRRSRDQRSTDLDANDTAVFNIRPFDHEPNIKTDSTAKVEKREGLYQSSPSHEIEPKRDSFIPTPSSNRMALTVTNPSDRSSSPVQIAQHTNYTASCTETSHDRDTIRGESRDLLPVAAQIETSGIKSPPESTLVEHHAEGVAHGCLSCRDHDIEGTWNSDSPPMYQPT